MSKLDHFQCQKTAIEQIKERFETMNLSYDAYRYVEQLFILHSHLSIV